MAMNVFQIFREMINERRLANVRWDTTVGAPSDFDLLLCLAEDECSFSKVTRAVSFIRDL